MVLDIIFVTLELIALFVILWVHLGKDFNGKEFSYRLKISTCWVSLTILGIINFLYYAFGPNHRTFNLVVGLIILVEICVEAVFVVYRLDKELEENEE
jgi:hypothetical protein